MTVKIKNVHRKSIPAYFVQSYVTSSGYVKLDRERRGGKGRIGSRGRRGGE